MLKTYNELIKINDYEERFHYLELHGSVGEDTFGFDRWMNQQFYMSKEWKRARNFVISRDLGCDLAHPDYEIKGHIVVHHMNPILPKDISDSTEFLLNPQYLITVSDITHRAIHYGGFDALPKDIIERKPGDTSLWTSISTTTI